MISVGGATVLADGTGGVALSTATPQAPGTAAAGSTGQASDAGHVHPLQVLASAGLLAARPAASASTLGSTYLATDTGVVYLAVTDGAGSYAWLPSVIALDGDPAGTAAICDGSDGLTRTSAAVSALLASADAAAARTALGVSSGSHTSGTLAARPGSPAVGDSYEVTSGTATGDKYVCMIAGAWTLVAFSRIRLDEVPYHWWRLDDASGGAVDSGSGATNLAEQGTLGSPPSIVYRAQLAPGDGIRFGGTTGAKRLQSAINTGVALTTAATLSAWIRADSSGGNQEIVALETNRGTNAQPYFSLALHINNGYLRVWVTTTASSGSGQALSVYGILAGCFHLVGLTFSASTLTAWIDGVAIGSAAITGSTIFTAGSAEYWTISDATGPGERLMGLEADVRVYDTAKTAAWWRETYRRGVGSYEGA